MPPRLQSLDHLVLTVADPTVTCEFYSTVLGMQVETFQPKGSPVRQALHFGKQKINLHQAGQEFEPKANSPLPGSADLCFLSKTALEDWVGHLSETGTAIEQGPIDRTGAQGPIRSIYLRDPDGNLIEISNQI